MWSRGTERPAVRCLWLQTARELDLTSWQYSRGVEEFEEFVVVLDSWAIVMIWCVSSTELSLGPNDVRMPVCRAFYLHFSAGESWESLSNCIYVTLHIENKAAHFIGTLVSIMSPKVRSVCQDADGSRAHYGLMDWSGLSSCFPLWLQASLNKFEERIFIFRYN